MNVVTVNVITVPTVLPWNFPHPRGNYRGYRGIIAFLVTVSSSSYGTRIFVL